jgi:hypothetical protein
MSEPKARRGRPKGTGIDDSHRLHELDRVIKNNPGIRPTTAIRELLGIGNPSTIRRLRDKYKQARMHAALARSDAAPRHPGFARTAPINRSLSAN